MTMKYPTPEEMEQALQPATIPAQQSEEQINSQEIQDHRKNICFSCQFYDAAKMECSVCNHPVVMMAQLNFKSCPKGYWS